MNWILVNMTPAALIAVANTIVVVRLPNTYGYVVPRIRLYHTIAEAHIRGAGARYNDFPIATLIPLNPVINLAHAPASMSIRFCLF